jgi:hypothetical protein
MTFNASPPASTPANGPNLPMSRPTNQGLEYDSEVETLVRDESDDDTIPQPRSSTRGQPTAGDQSARWFASDKPCVPTQRNIEAVTRARELKEREDAGQRERR